MITIVRDFDKVSAEILEFSLKSDFYIFSSLKTGHVTQLLRKSYAKVTQILRKFYANVKQMLRNRSFLLKTEIGKTRIFTTLHSLVESRVTRICFFAWKSAKDLEGTF
jgi:hypothetical protein